MGFLGLFESREEKLERRREWAKKESVRAFNIVRVHKFGREYDAVVYSDDIIISMPDDTDATGRLAAFRKMYEEHLLESGLNPNGWNI